jgi:hypothetical protein
MFLFASPIKGVEENRKKILMKKQKKMKRNSIYFFQWLLRQEKPIDLS